MRFFDKKLFEKKIRSYYHNSCEISLFTDVHTYIHTYMHAYIHTKTHTHTPTHRIFLKIGSVASWGLKKCLYAKKSKFHLKQWCLNEEPKIVLINIRRKKKLPSSGFELCTLRGIRFRVCNLVSRSGFKTFINTITHSQVF